MDVKQIWRLAAVSVLMMCGRVTEACTKEELVMVQMIVRHGATSPTVLYPEDPNPESAWTEGLDDLTMLGKFQPYALGSFIKNHYEDLISSDPTELEVMSSGHKDCVKSALSFATALSAPTPYWEIVQNFAWQPIFVYYEKEEVDKYFSYPECPAFEEAYNEQIGRETVALFKKYQNLVYYWQINSGWELQNIASVELLYNVLESEAAHNLTIPKWAQDYWNELKYFHDVAFASKLKTKIQQRLKGGPIVGLLLDAMKKKAAGESDKTKVMVYSTHGFNIAAYLSVLGMWNYQRPRPCTTLLVELYNHENEHYVRYLYLNSTTPEREPQIFYVLKVPGCTEFCPLNYLIDYTKDLIPENWDEECQVP